MPKSILEVWDYRLSTAAPLVYKKYPADLPLPKDLEPGRNNWIAAVYDKGESNAPLELFNSGVAVEEGDTDDNMPDSIYEFFRSVRDKYALPNIEALKPKVREIRRIDVIRQKATDAYNKVMVEAEGGSVT